MRVGYSTKICRNRDLFYSHARDVHCNICISAKHKPYFLLDRSPLIYAYAIIHLVILVYDVARMKNVAFTTSILRFSCYYTSNHVIHINFTKRSEKNVIKTAAAPLTVRRMLLKSSLF